MTDHVFVYGTLRQGFGLHQYLADCEFVGCGIAKGYALIDLGGCPGLIPARCYPEDYARGEIYRSGNITNLLRQLDRAENQGRMYRRVQADISTESGPEACWTYLYMLPCFDETQIVPRGVWNPQGQSMDGFNTKGTQSGRFAGS